jgi:hypothetical protein
VWCGVVWCVVWCGVVCGVVWCGVVRCNAAAFSNHADVSTSMHGLLSAMAVSLLQVQGAGTTRTSFSHQRHLHRIRTCERHCGLSAASTEASQRCSAPPQRYRVARRAAAAVRVGLTSQPVVRCDACRVPLPLHPLVIGVATLADIRMRRASRSVVEWVCEFTLLTAGRCGCVSHHYTHSQ